MNSKQSRGSVDKVMGRLEIGLFDGTYPAHARLPSERELAQRYAVSRNTVREAIQRLAARGLVRIKPGAGIFVSDQLRSGMTSPWGQLVAAHQAVREDMLEFRRVLEGATAFFAALRATPQDKERIRSLVKELELARSRDDHEAESDVDARLHDAIALASHNTMFLHLQGSIVTMLRENITHNVAGLRALDPAVPMQLLLQHRNICDAICARQPEEARTAMQAHIDYVRTHLPIEGGEA